MAIKIHYDSKNDFFWADSAKGSAKTPGSDASILKEAGFRFNYDYGYGVPRYVPNFVWWTRDPIAATKMQNFADDSAIEAIRALESEISKKFSIHYKEAGELSYFYATDVGRQHESILRGTYDKDTREHYGLRNSKDSSAKFEQKYSIPPNTWWTPSLFMAGIYRPFAVGKAAELIDTKNAIVTQSFADNSDLEIPFPKGLKPYNYQKAGIAWALKRTGVMIADEQGLGKTIQAIGICNIDETINDVLCICPSAVKINWTQEFEKWCTRKAQIKIISKTDDIPNPKKGYMRFMVINFDKFSSSKEQALLMKAFMEMRLDMIVIDEAHYLKNPKSKRTRAILGYRDTKEPYAYHDGIATVAKKRIYLTGTPIKNRPVELWSLASTLDPETFDNYFAYVYRYCAATKNDIYNPTLRKVISVLDVSGSSYLRELEDLLRSTFMIRRLKSNVLTQLPAKTRQLILLEPDPETQKLIDQEKARMSQKDKGLLALIEKAKITNNNADYIAAANTLETGGKIAFDEVAALRRDIGIRKAPLVVDHIKSLVDSMSNGVDKVIVFCHHHTVVDLIKYGLTHKKEKVGRKFEEIETDEYKPVVYTGKENDQQKQKAKDSFQNDPTIKVFIGTSAAYAGITLTAANVVVFAELSFVPSDMLQGEDRAHRIGQKKNVTVQHMAFDGSIDAKISQMLVAKMDVISSALDIHTDIEISEEDVPTDVKQEEIVKKIEVAGIKASTEMEMEEVVESTDKTKKKAPVATVYTYTDEQKETAHAALQYLASICDGATEKDGMGFNKPNSGPGKRMANQSELTDNDMQESLRILNTHRSQLDNHTRDILGLWPKDEKPIFSNKQKKTLLTVGKWIIDNIGDKLETIDLEILTEESSRLENEQDMSDKLADSFKNILNTYWNDIDSRYQAVMKSMKLRKGRGRPKKIPASDDTVIETVTPKPAPKSASKDSKEYTPPEIISVKDIDWGEELFEDDELKQSSGKIDHRLTYKLWKAKFDPAVIIQEFNKVTSIRNVETKELNRIGIFYKKSDGKTVSPNKYAYIKPGTVPGIKTTLVIIPGIDEVIVESFSISDHKVAEMFVEQLSKEKSKTPSAVATEKETKKPISDKYSKSQKETARLAIKYLDEYFDAMKQEKQATPYTDQWISDVKKLNSNLPELPSDSQIETIIKVLKMHKPIFKPMGVFEKLGVTLRTIKR